MRLYKPRSNVARRRVQAAVSKQPAERPETHKQRDDLDDWVRKVMRGGQGFIKNTGYYNRHEEVELDESKTWKDSSGPKAVKRWREFKAAFWDAKDDAEAFDSMTKKRNARLARVDRAYKKAYSHAHESVEVDESYEDAVAKGKKVWQPHDRDIFDRRVSAAMQIQRAHDRKMRKMGAKPLKVKGYNESVELDESKYNATINKLKAQVGRGYDSVGKKIDRDHPIHREIQNLRSQRKKDAQRRMGLRAGYEPEGKQTLREFLERNRNK